MANITKAISTHSKLCRTAFPLRSKSAAVAGVTFLVVNIKQLIENKSIIEIDLDPSYETSYVGICLKDDEVTILVNFNEANLTLDGYSIFRCSDIYMYRECDCQDYLIEELNTLSSKIDISVFNSFSESLLHASQFGLIAFFENGDLDTYFVGYLNNIKEQLCTFDLIDEKGKNIGSKKIDIDSIVYFSFYTKYEIAFMKQKNVTRA